MSKDASLLNRMLGAEVGRVLVEVLFHEMERVGTIAGIVIELQDGKTYNLGCSGDGGIFVLKSRKNKIGSAPGYIRVEKPIENLVGPLSDVIKSDASLVLTIGGHRLEIINEDDEMALILDYGGLEKEIFTR